MDKIANSPTIAQAFKKRTFQEPKKVGFRYKKSGEWIDVTFEEHYKNVQQIACALMHLGVKKNTKVNILAQTSIYWSQMDLAILCSGGITVPVYPTSTPEDTTFIINHCESEIIFVDDFINLKKLANLAKSCSGLKKVIVNFEFLESELADTHLEIIHWNKLLDIGLNQGKTKLSQFEENLDSIKEDDIFTICYTSGTTGTPKGVVLTHRSIGSTMKDVSIVMDGILSEQEELLSFLPMSHIFGKWESMTPYYLGWQSSYAESIDTLVGNLAEVRPTLWIAVPRIFEKVYAKIMLQVSESPPAKQKIFKWAIAIGKKVLDTRQAGKKPKITDLAQLELAKKLVFNKISDRFGGRIRFCLSGSAPLAKNIQEFMHIVGVPVYEGYGLTETCAPVCVNLPNANKFGTVGKLFPEVLAKIAEDGEILLKTDKNFTSYYKNPEATAESLKDNWFYTGDIGHLDEDGYLCITDRKKDLIKTAGGKFIAPQKIESLAKHESVISQIVVYGDQKPYAVALITTNPEVLAKFAQDNKLIYSEYAELLKNPKVLEEVDSAIERVNKKLARYETIKKFILVASEFTVESGELTPSMKIKRKHICSKYQKQLDALYTE
ncbi:MAG: long-chain fatty acid--CoA ligase [Oligoflexia bacterium]|nr:long-chain fatty acid--CoA ligase [Oligoflexia bacterium]